MSGECDKCGEHCLDCICTLIDKLQPFCRRQQNDPRVRVSEKIIPISEGIDPPPYRVDEPPSA